MHSHPVLFPRQNPAESFDERMNDCEAPYRALRCHQGASSSDGCGRCIIDVAIALLVHNQFIREVQSKDAGQHACSNQLRSAGAESSGR